jgi:hypothetical protein
VSIVTNQDFVQMFFFPKLERMWVLPLSTSGNGVICKNAKMALNLSDVIHDEIGLILYRGKSLHAYLVHFNCEVLKIVHACLLSYEICISFSS